ncbi:MAG TPA: PadR family transcriptional regulator [Pseudonocardia sp.]|nr:PadR family transcriptional regulator [Pseudonocardia sp.]
MNAMNPAWEPPAWGMRDRLRRHRHGRPPFGPHAAAMDADGPPVPPPPFADPEEDGPRGPGRRGRRHGGPRFGPGFGPGFGPSRFPGGFPGPRGRRRGRRTARGDIRAAVLALVAEQPRHGYEIIQEIAERTGGAWRPSPGSVYPTLSQLEDEGLVRVEQNEGRRVVHLTEAGTTYVAEHRAELDAVWASVGTDGDDETVELWDQLAQLHAATQQVMAAGNAEQIAAATAALAEARKSIYRLLAE